MKEMPLPRNGIRRALHLGYLAAFRIFLWLLFRIFYRYRALGRENLPRGGGRVILAANHLSYLDPILVAIGTWHTVRFMAWSQLFHHGLFSSIIRTLGAFPVNVLKWDVAAYRAALDCLE